MCWHERVLRNNTEEVVKICVYGTERSHPSEWEEVLLVSPVKASAGAPR